MLKFLRASSVRLLVLTYLRPMMNVLCRLPWRVLINVDVLVRPREEELAVIN